ncbi:three-Cys-motif partner protein TcmP [Halostella sp. PRR32]|uniref:three-Cys-motif partner protein TcmP n=1 Tax=Halostella sp. PRR32 TaxID=3098147 RepID=UPI002B1E43B0|nr:three-Cys-motif partner protein TcmP [Halostella sp. PRR32]
MPLSDNDDDKWKYKEHTAAKHEVYQKYLTPWTYKLTYSNEKQGKYNKIRIVDCFSGRGSYTEAIDCTGPEMHHIDTPADIPGSPQIILDKLTQHTDQFKEAEAIFIEADEENFDILNDNLGRTSRIADNINKSCINGKFQEEIFDVINSTDGSDCPTLFFIDPFGFKSLDYDVITEIGSTSQFEFLITFMSRDINRFFDVEYHEDAIETVFGHAEYKDEVDQYSAENWEALVEYYTDRLEENGPEHTFEYLITEPDTRQTVYYLVFGTNHSNGLHTMREIMHNCGTGNFGYAPRHVEHDRQQTGLGAFGGGADNTEQFLLDNFEDFRIEFGNLVEKCSEIRKYQDTVESDYRQAIKNLEAKGELEVIRFTSVEGGSGVQRGDLIDFRNREHED